VLRKLFKKKNTRFEIVYQYKAQYLNAFGFKGPVVAGDRQVVVMLVQQQ
jgi:hypothetical protein